MDLVDNHSLFPYTRAMSRQDKTTAHRSLAKKPTTVVVVSNFALSVEVEIMKVSYHGVTSVVPVVMMRDRDRTGFSIGSEVLRLRLRSLHEYCTSAAATAFRVSSCHTVGASYAFSASKFC